MRTLPERISIMPASEARIEANRKNALLSSGPKTPEGKEQSRANAYKHGMTGAGVVLPEREAAEVKRRVAAFSAELNPSGEVGLALVRRAATLSVRMERCVEHENSRLADRVRQAEAEFVAPEGADEVTTARLRAEVGKLALFDPSPEACLARKYEAAAERGFFRALAELRQVEKAARAAEEADEELEREALASFDQLREMEAEFDALCPEAAPPSPRNRIKSAASTPPPAFEGRGDVPISTGRRR